MTFSQQLGTYKVLVDTCAFMNDSFFALALGNMSQMKKQGYSLYTASVVVNELIHIANSAHQTDADRQKAQDAVWLIKLLSKNKVLNFIEVQSNNHSADHIFISYILSNCTSQKIELITQDKELGKNVMAINSIETAVVKGVRVAYFLKGELVELS
jgi:rRNA-processing protein FCF1